MPGGAESRVSLLARHLRRSNDCFDLPPLDLSDEMPGPEALLPAQAPLMAREASLRNAFSIGERPARCPAVGRRLPPDPACPHRRLLQTS